MDLEEKKHKEALKRAEKNKEIIERMQNPDDPLSLYSPTDTWFPPRPLTVKDKDAVRRLYGDGIIAKEESGTGEVKDGRSGEEQ